MLLLSICAYGLVSLKYKEIEVQAADSSTVNCYYLLGEDGLPYKSNKAVGSLDNLGEYVVGKDNIGFNATAKGNYHLVGWRIVYDEQESKTEYFYLNNNFLIY